MVLLPPSSIAPKVLNLGIIGNCPPSVVKTIVLAFTVSIHVFVLLCVGQRSVKARSTESQCSDGVFRKRALFCCGFLGLIMVNCF